MQLLFRFLTMTAEGSYCKPRQSFLYAGVELARLALGAGARRTTMARREKIPFMPRRGEICTRCPSDVKAG